MTDDAAAVAALRAGVEAGLAAQPMPSAVPVRELADGFSSVVFAAGDELVVRVVTDAVAAQRSAATVRLLGALAGQLPVAVPELVAELPVSRALPYGAQVFRRLPGRVLEPDPQRGVVADELVGFLTRLHTLGDDYRAAGVDPGVSVDVELTEAIVPLLTDRLSRDDFAEIVDWRDRFLGWWRRAEKVPVHGDLWHENLLADANRLTGVLDWEVARFAPRAVDLCGLYHLGDDFGDLVTRRYADAVGRDPAELSAEVRLCRVARELEGVAWSLREVDDSELVESLDKLRAVLPLARA